MTRQRSLATSLCRKPDAAIRAGWLVVLAGSCLGARLEAAPQEVPGRSEFAAKVLTPFFQRHCLACHTGARAAGQVRLDELTAGDWTEQYPIWTKVIEQLESRNMPPRTKPRPDDGDYESLLGALRPALRRELLASNRVPPPAALRRLNRPQYRNVVRDLFGIDIDPTVHLPADETAYGFDNIGETLTVSPILMEQYLRMAREVAAAVVVTDPDDAAPVVARLEWPADRFKGKGPSRYSGERLVKPFSHAFEIPDDDEYLVKALTSGENLGNEPLLLALDVDGTEVARIAVGTTAFTWVRTRLRLTKGERQLTFRQASPTIDPKAAVKPPNRGPIILEKVVIGRPSRTTAATYPEPHRRVMSARPGAARSVREAATAIFQPLASRAYRRPATDAQIDRLTAVVEQAHQEGAPFDRSIQVGIQAMLSSPHFLYITESERSGAAPRLLDEYELASRLSFFLWNTMPDGELLEAARQGRLRADLDRHIDRMIADRRFEEFCRSFTHQWLKLRRLDEFRPDPRGPQKVDFDQIRESALRETELFFATIVRENLDLMTLIDADFTVLDAPLSKLYGLNPEVPKDAGFQRVGTAGIKRGGILTQASVLAATSYPTRTSPVLRGAWVLENLLNSPPPAPPPEVPPLESANDPESAAKLSLRQQLERHRATASCAVCHHRIDPLGFALEGFDIMGRVRTIDDSKQPIDTAAVLPTGESIQGVEGLKRVLLKSKKEQFLTCVTEKMMVYALARGPDPADMRTVHKIVDELTSGHGRARTLIEGVIRSEAFNTK